jgi:hypothetical protein
MADISTFNAALKEDYGQLLEQLSSTTVLVAQLEKKSDTADGKRALHALHVGRNGGIGGAETGANLPTPGQQAYVNAYIPLRKRYAAIQLERQLFKITDTNAGAFAEAVEAEMKGVKKDVRVDEGRQVYGTSDGVVAAAGLTTPAATTINLATTTTATQLRQLQEFAGVAGQGRLIDIGTVASPGATAADRTLLSVDVANKTITISGATITTATTDRIFWANQGGASSASNLQNDGQIELTGLQTLIGTGNVHGVNATTYPMFKSYVSSNGGTNRAVSENLINTALFNVETNSDGAVDLLISNFGVFNAVAADMRAMRRNNDTVALKGGFTGVAYSIPGQGQNDGSSTRSIVWDRDCPNNTLFGVSTTDIINYEAAPWEWLEETGSIWKQATNSGGRLDAYVADMARYHDFAITRRNSQFKISDLSE